MESLYGALIGFHVGSWNRDTTTQLNFDIMLAFLRTLSANKSINTKSFMETLVPLTDRYSFTKKDDPGYTDSGALYAIETYSDKLWEGQSPKPIQSLGEKYPEYSTSDCLHRLFPLAVLSEYDDAMIERVIKTTHRQSVCMTIAKQLFKDLRDTISTGQFDYWNLTMLILGDSPISELSDIDVSDMTEICRSVLMVCCAIQDFNSETDPFDFISKYEDADSKQLLGLLVGMTSGIMRFDKQKLCENIPKWYIDMIDDICHTFDLETDESEPTETSSEPESSEDIEISTAATITATTRFPHM